MTPQSFQKKKKMSAMLSHPGEGGFVLLFAALITSMVLAISLGIFSLIIKEVELSGASRESQRALYAADAGTECVLYWDIQEKAFSTTSAQVIQCADDVATVGGGFTSSFSLSFDNDTCVDVVVDKVGEETVITSRGRNTCNTESSRRIERALQVRY